jgi:hypothetical protein
MVAVAEEGMVVDVDALQRGGVNLTRIADTAKDILTELQVAVDTLNDFGTDKTGASIRATYGPIRDDGLKFLAATSELLDMHGGRTSTTGKVMDDVNTATSAEANAGPSHGKRG